MVARKDDHLIYHHRNRRKGRLSKISYMLTLEVQTPP
jgi:hypothetical protein